MKSKIIYTNNCGGAILGGKHNSIHHRLRTSGKLLEFKDTDRTERKNILKKLTGLATLTRYIYPFQTIIFARWMGSTKWAIVLGPQSKPIHPSGIPASRVAA